jgi:uncharacterized protein (UPF0147 family)
MLEEKGVTSASLINIYADVSADPNPYLAAKTIAITHVVFRCAVCRPVT